MKNIDWKAYLVIIPVVLLVMDFIIIKAFGQKAFMLAFLRWINKMFHANREIKAILEGQNKEVKSQNELIYSILVKLETIENEVKFNGGKYKLVDAVSDILNNQSVYSSEREADMYIDPRPMFKTDSKGAVTFVNAAWLEMVGCTDEEEVKGFGYMVAIPDQNKDLVEKTSARFAKNQAPYHDDFTYMHTKTKELIYTNVRTQLIKDRSGVVVGTLGTVKILN